MAFGKRNAPQSASAHPTTMVFGKLRQPELPTAAAGATPARPELTIVVSEPMRPAQPPRLQAEPAQDEPVQDGLGFRESIDTEAIARASSELLGVMINAYGDARDSQLETVMGALAALAGEFCLRAGAEAAGPEAVQELSSGQQYVAGGLADPYLYGEGCAETLHIWGMICSAAADAGGSLHDLPDPRALRARAVAAIETGQPYPPPLQIPERSFPHEWSPNACPRHRQTVRDVMAGSGIVAADEIAMALGIAMMMVFPAAKDSFEAGTLTPETLASLALEIMIAVARMAPLETVVE
jgi:hypothetical protein